MAYSPSPLAIASHSQLKQYRPNFPQSQPLTKREKKLSDMEDRFAQIGQQFNENRDIYYRKEHQSIQYDIDFIRNADLYSAKTLDETGDELIFEPPISAAVSFTGSLRTQASTGNAKTEIPYGFGRNAAQFAHAINDAMEQRDADLTAVVYHHNFRIDELLKDNEFHVAVAHQESQRQLEALRRRLVLNLTQKKTALQKEKEKLDNSETNTLLHYPSQFSINNGASPGGPQSNRKTRHTRHRLEVEDIDATNGNNKRKRKFGVDADNGSPAPAGREVELATNSRDNIIKPEYQEETPQIYSIEQLFSNRELEANRQQATYEVIEDMKRRRMSKYSNTHPNAIVGHGIDSSDSEDNVDPTADLGGTADDMTLAAPEMDRIPTNASQHLTRSTRGIPPTGEAFGTGNLGYLSGRQSGAAYIGNVGTVGSREKKREDEYQRAPPLSEAEAEADLRLIEAAIAEEDAGGTSLIVEQCIQDTMEDIESRVDYVGTASLDGDNETLRIEEGNEH